MEEIKIYLAIFSITLLAAVALLFLFQQIFKISRDPNEPPYIEPKFPFIGHFMGLIWEKHHYYVKLRYRRPPFSAQPSYHLIALRFSKKSKLRIYGLLMPGMVGNRVYIINSPDLVVAVQRMHTKLSFWPVMAAFTSGTAGLSTYVAKTFLENAHGEEGNPSMMRSEMHNAHTSFKSGGQALSSATNASLKILAPSIGSLGQQDVTRLELGRWIADTVMTSVTGSIFGSKNPFEDPSVGNAFE